MPLDQANYQYFSLSSPGQLKSNVQARLDYLSGVFANLSELVSKIDLENRQMKEFITILLHFKYMLQFLKNNLIRDDELFKRLGPDAAILFKTDLKQCLTKFNKVIESSQCLNFVSEKNEYYQSNPTYCSYIEDDILCMRQRKSRTQTTTTESITKQGITRIHNQPVSRVEHAPLVEKNINEEVEHRQIKIEPEVEILELQRPVELNESMHSDESSRDNNRFNSLHVPVQASLMEKSSTSSSSDLSQHKQAKEKQSNDLKFTIITTPQSSHKVVKRSQQEAFDESGSNTSSQRERSVGKKPKSGKSQLLPFEQQNSQDEFDYDFDYEKDEFEDDDYAGVGQCQIRCPQSGCMSTFDSEMDLNEHLNTTHFNVLGLIPTYDCLVEGCTEKFPNLARANVHMRQSHPDSYITCDQCQKQVKAHYLRKHVYMRHRKGEYKCGSSDCGYVANFYHELEKHRYNFHYNRSMTGLWQDQISGASGTGGMATAMANQHQPSSSNNSSNNNSEDMPSSAGLRLFRRFTCKWQDCDFSSESRNRVLKHIRIHHLGQSSRNGHQGGSINPAEDRAAFEYLDVVEYSNNSFYYAD